MKGVSRLWKRVKRAWKTIHLVDRCLMVFMLVLLAQSAFVLFAGSGNTQENNNIDIVVRTSAAAIFGYFISANFIKGCTGADDSEDCGCSVKPPALPKGKAGEGPRAQIGFASGEAGEGTPVKTGGADFTPSRRERSCSHLQILVVSAVGLISLCVMLFFRDFGHMSAQEAGTMSQLRDFVSGCVGFLIGTETTGEMKKE